MPRALADRLADGPDIPTIVVLQAGNVHSGAFDPFAEAIEAAHAHGAWVHVDGAFGLFAGGLAAAARTWSAGYEAADSWATDAHKTLNVPYDCGLAIVRDAAALRAAMGMHGDYLIQDDAGDSFDKVPELSRRGRAFTGVGGAARAGPGRRRGSRRRLLPARHARSRTASRDDRRRRGAQRRGLHPGLRRVRGRRRGPRAVVQPAARRRDGLDDRLTLARPGRPADLGEQLVHDRRRRTPQPRRAAPRRGGMSHVVDI